MTIKAELSPIAGLAEKQHAMGVLFQQAAERNGGGRAWRGWKLRSAHAVIDLVTRSPRMELFALSLEGDFECVFRIQAPVPRWPDDSRLVIGREVACHLLYGDEWRVTSPPGWAPVGILRPHDIFHANFRPHLRGALCLGGLPPNTPPDQLIFATFDALTLQAMNTDESDPAGILNLEAATYFRHHREYLPLTRAGLFDSTDLDPKWELS
jgi:hypothetical protein